MRLAARFMLVLSVCLLVVPADARKPEDVFKGEIVVLKKPLPLKFKSGDAFIAEVKRNRIDQVWPQDKAEKSWKIEYAAFFAAPLNDMQAEAKFYDVTDPKRQPKFITSDTQYTPKRGERYLFNSIVLEKTDDTFKPNKRYLMQLVSKKKIIASTKFVLRGKAQQFSGKVTFTDEDTKKQDE
ncbi:MAG TPA: hypothetical protein VGQ83_38540 [Polyangia bacterium]